MKLLVLGGSVFLSRAVADEAVLRGHDVTCACRSTAVPRGARHVVLDRSLYAPVDDGYDAVVDVARMPSFVRNAVAAIPNAHWVFVSTINVYDDTSTPGGGPGRLPLVDPEPLDVDPAGEGAYGRMKVACEELVSDGVESCTIVRPGLIVGPGDPTGRFTYWPARLVEGGEVLAPGDPDDLVQVIDVRDLAAWIVTAAEARLNGEYDGVGPALPLRELLAGVVSGVGTSLGSAATARLTWADQEFLTAQGVEAWAGPGSLPLWLPRPEYDGMLAHVGGIPTRPVSETAADVVTWLRAEPSAAVTGLTRDEEARLLQEWHSLHP